MPQPSLFSAPTPAAAGLSPAAAVAAFLAHLAPGGYSAGHLFALSCSSPSRARLIAAVCALAPAQPRPAIIAALRAAGCLP